MDNNSYLCAELNAKQVRKYTSQMTEALDVLEFKYEDTRDSSIYFVSKISEYLLSDSYSPYVIIGLEEARKFEADAVYFRSMDNGQPPMAQIYIYDNVTYRRSASEIAEIHRNIWSASQIPLYFVIERNSISVYDGRKPVTIDNQKRISISPVRDIPLGELNEAVRLYQAEQFSSGLFWEGKETVNNFRSYETVDKKLLNSLNGVRKALKSKCSIAPALADRLLIICILIKYLEENGVDRQGNNIAQEFFCQSIQVSSLVDAINKGRLNDLLECLSDHFNGGVFKVSSEEKAAISSSDLSFLASFLEGKLLDGKYFVIWQEYSFKYIPIELISNFYEEFLPKNEKTKKKIDTSAVYTPNHLVKLLVDECLPLNGEFKSIIDVSCGSGIFLVTAFRRLAQMWRYQHRINGHLADADEYVLQKLIRENIFGVDINSTATQLTVFSLNLALCSMLSPQQIWTKLKFEDLTQNNIRNIDFFEFLVKTKRQYDLVIGNPPFKEYKKEDYNRVESLLEENSMGFEGKIARQQSSLMFLDRAITLLKGSGQLCLILPSGPFLHSNQQDSYRDYFFSKYNVTQIIDFTFLKTLLFKGANVATVALFANNRPPETEEITHIVAKRNGASKEEAFLEFDSYDFYNVPVSLAQKDKRVWKCNLLGGAVVYSLFEKYGQFQTIGAFLESKKGSGWYYGEGYTIGNKAQKADYITGHPSIVDSSFSDDGLFETIVEMSEGFIRPRDKQLYEPPHLLIKRSIGSQRFPVALSHDYVTFKEGITGIHCPKEDLLKLEQLKSYIHDNNDLLRLLLVANSSRAGITRSIYSNYHEDFLSLPYFKRQGDDYNENIIISDAIKYMFPYFDSTTKAAADESASYDDLKNFGNLFCKRLNLIYGKEEKKYTPTVYYEGENYFIYVIDYTNNNHILRETNSKEDLYALLNFKSENYNIKRVIRIYEENRIIMIKPKQIRYWLKSIALRDVSETLNDVINYWCHEQRRK